MDPIKAATLHRYAGGIMKEIQSENPAAKVRAFVALAKSIMLSEKSRAHHAVTESQNPLVLAAIEKASVSPYLLSDDTLWGTGPLGELVANYLPTVAEGSIIDLAIAYGARVIPQNNSRAIIGTGVTAGTATEGGPKAALVPGLNREDATAAKAAGLLVLSDELAREAGTELFERELRNAVQKACNQAVIGLLTDSNSPTAATLDGAIALAGESENYIVCMSPGDVAAMAVQQAGTGSGTLGVRGGQLCPGVILIAVDGIAATTVIPVSRVAIRDHGLELRPAAHATVELDTSPVGGASSVMTSLWQENLRGLLIERRFEIAVDPAEVAIIGGE